MSGDAHPAAFEGYTINPARMVSLAQSIEPDAIPPEVRIAVTAEELGIEGVDYFGEGLSEQLFDTPGAIARIWRSKAGDADDDRLGGGDPRPERPAARIPLAPAPGRPGKGHDRALRGRHQRDDHPRLARPLRHLRGQPGRPRPASTSASSPRTASTTSAPAILSWYFPPSEKRRTEPGPDGAPRIAAIDHTNPGRAYADPILVPRADWRDDFAYDAGGTLLGWTRVRGDRPTEAFDAEGRRLPDPGNPAAAVDGRLSAVAGRGRPARGRGDRCRPLLSRGSACCVAACSHPPGGTL